MATTPTTNPIPSESPRDLKFNAGKIDEFVNSANENYTDRFGAQRFTIEGFRHLAREAIAAFGYVTVDSFEDGATITLPNQVLRYESTGEYYRWDGSLPKTVAPGSTPSSSGGIGSGAWISVGDASLRASLRQSSGAGLVGFGATTVFNHLVKDIRYYGGVGDGVADDTAAVQLAANTGHLIFGPGTYKVTAPITISAGQDCVVKGNSRSDTTVLYTGTGTMFSCTFTNSIRFIEVSNIRFLASSLATVEGFYFAWPEDFEHGYVQRGSFENVSMRGVDEYEQGFNVCVHMHQGDNINFINCEFKGAGGGTGDQSRTYNTRCGIGVQVTGRYSPVEYRFIGCYFGSFDRGIDIGDTAEGIYVSNCIFIGTGTCIKWETGFWSPNWPGTGGQSAAGRPLLSVHNSHLSYFQYGVYTNGVGSIHESNLLTYHNSNSDVNGIALAHGNSADIFIRDIESWGFASNVYTDGIVFYTFVRYSTVNNFKSVAAAPNAYRYAVEVRNNSTNNSFRQITRRANDGSSFTTNVLINDLSGGLNDIGMIKGGLFYSTANQSIASGTGTAVGFGARSYDPDTMWPGFGAVITIPPGVNRIKVSGQVLFDSTASSTYREIRIARNGSQGIGLPAQSTLSAPSKGTYMNLSGCSMDVVAGDQITLIASQDSGNNLNLISGQCWLQVEIVN